MLGVDCFRSKCLVLVLEAVSCWVHIIQICIHRSLVACGLHYQLFACSGNFLAYFFSHSAYFIKIVAIHDGYVIRTRTNSLLLCVGVFMVRLILHSCLWPHWCQPQEFFSGLPVVQVRECQFVCTYEVIQGWEYNHLLKLVASLSFFFLFFFYLFLL